MRVAVRRPTSGSRGCRATVRSSPRERVTGRSRGVPVTHRIWLWTVRRRIRSPPMSRHFVTSHLRRVHRPQDSRPPHLVRPARGGCAASSSLEPTLSIGAAGAGRPCHPALREARDPRQSARLRAVVPSRAPGRIRRAFVRLLLRIASHSCAVVVLRLGRTRAGVRGAPLSRPGRASSWRSCVR